MGSILPRAYPAMSGWVDQFLAGAIRPCAHVRRVLVARRSIARAHRDRTSRGDVARWTVRSFGARDPTACAHVSRPVKPSNLTSGTLAPSLRCVRGRDVLEPLERPRRALDVSSPRAPLRHARRLHVAGDRASRSWARYGSLVR